MSDNTPNSCTYVDGIASTPAIDTAGEIVDLAGIDCSSLIGGALNWEHKSDLPAQIVGKIIDYKKIFSEEDCENERHEYYWNKCKGPFLYVLGRLFDDKKDSSKECAALFLDDAEHPDEHPMVGFSIEGSKVDKKGIIVTKSIARKLTITNANANKQCSAEMVPADPEKPDTDSIFKSEPTFTIELLSKTENPMKTPDWSQGKQIGKDSLAFTHPEHGTVSIQKQPAGDYHVKHQGAIAGLKGNKGVFKTPEEAGTHAKNYMGAVSSGRVLAPKMQNFPSAGMGKSMTAGSGMGSPGTLSGGAALGKESLDKKIRKSLGSKTGVHQPTQRSGEDQKGGQSRMGTQVRAGNFNNAKAAAKATLMGARNIKPKLDKSEWLARAEQEYKTWEKREEFENFMAKNMPNLAKGEVIALGQALCLKKSMKDEKKLAKLIKK